MEFKVKRQLIGPASGGVTYRPQKPLVMGSQWQQNLIYFITVRNVVVAR